jgi:hypothetical protein
MVPQDHVRDQPARRNLDGVRTQLGAPNAALSDPQALWTSRIRWETTVLTPSPRIVTP